MINKLFRTFVAKAAVVALAGGFATGGLVAAGAFTGGAPSHEAAHVAGAKAISLAASSNPEVAQAKVAVEATSTVDAEDHEATSTVKADPDEHHSRPTATVTPKPVRPTTTPAPMSRASPIPIPRRTAARRRSFRPVRSRSPSR